MGSFQDGAKGKGKGKPGKGNSLVDLSEMLHECEWDKSTPEKPFKHRFEVRFLSFRLRTRRGPGAAWEADALSLSFGFVFTGDL